MHYYSFEKLDVWKDSRKFAKKIYALTRSFPDTEKFGMTNQVRRATVSICSNIAEGNSRKSSKDRANFFQIAYSSTMEVLCQLILSCDFEWIKTQQLNECRVEINKISNKLNALYNAQFEQ